MTAETDSSTSNGRSAASEAPSVLRAVPESLHPTVQTLVAQIEVAAHRLQALQAENERLRARLQELEQRPDIPESALVLPLADAETDTLEDRLDAYIEAIDLLLDDLPAPDSEPSTAPDASSSA